MKPLLILALAALAAAGCATIGDERLAKADCKVAPLTTASVAGGRPKPVDPIYQRQAEADLRSSAFHRHAQAAYVDPPTQKALRDCP